MRGRRLGARGLEGVVVALVGAAALVVVAAPPAYACSCAATGAPAFAFSGIAVEDLGYTPAGATGLGEEHTWVLQVDDARLGVEPGPVRISMVVGRVQRGDSFGVNGCGMDDNLVIGERYEVVSGGLERMISCGSLVTGRRAPVPDRSDPSAEISNVVLYLAAAGAALLLGGVAVAIARRRSVGPPTT